MPHQLDDNGELDVSKLTLEEKIEIFEKFESIILDAEAKWSETYGPFERIEDTSAEEFAAKLVNTPDELIWADVNYFEEATYVTVIEGLTVAVNGWAYLPGRQEYYNVERYLIASKPYREISNTCVYSFAQCLCPFCDGGDIADCEICEGNRNWEFLC